MIRTLIATAALALIASTGAPNPVWAHCHAEALHRAAAGQHKGKRVAARDAATAEERRDGTHGHALSRSDGKAQRMARRRRRPVGARPLLDRRTAAAGIHSGRRRAEEEGAAVDRMDVAESARGRILRTGQGLRI